MRIGTFLLVMTVAWPAGAAARQADAPPAPPQESAAAPEPEPDEDALPTTFGTLNLGVRGTHLSGDGARYERYRDLGNGLFLDGSRIYSERRGWVFDASVDHVGRLDQRYTGSIVRPGRFKLWGQWDQIPMLMSRATQTLFTEAAPGVLQIDDAIQASVQAQASNLAAALQSARPFDLKSRRDFLTVGTQYIVSTSATDGLTVDVNLRRIDRDGAIPYGGSFGHSQVVETLAPVEHTVTDFDTSAEYVLGRWLVRGGYTGSWFRNDATSLTFDNPFRLTDTPTAGSRGRLALPPSNSYVGVNGLISYRAPYRTRVSLYGSFGNLRDTDDPLLPFTINPALAPPPLDRPATEGHARTSAMNLTFTSRPTETFDIDVRLRAYDYDNRTPEFLTTARVAYDNAVSAVTNPALQHSEPFGVERVTFDADLRVHPLRALSASVGLGRHGEERTHRIFEDTSENVARVTVDSLGHRWFTLRSKYEHGERRGNGDASVIADELTAIGEIPGMRHFDIASRDRDRVTLIGTLLPMDAVSVNASFAAGKDDFLESEFGLRDLTTRTYSTGFDYIPSDYFGAGISYAFDRYGSLSRSRQANNAAEQADPARNWATDTSDKAHSVVGHFEMRDIRQRLDVSAFVDYSRASGLYRYLTGAVPDRTLPEEVIVPTNLPDPTQLPEVRSRLTRVNLDTLYSLTERWGVGASIWYERYRVRDFSLDAEAISRLDPTGGLLLGYTYLPYTATTFWARAVYKF